MLRCLRKMNARAPTAASVIGTPNPKPIAMPLLLRGGGGDSVDVSVGPETGECDLDGTVEEDKWFVTVVMSLVGVDAVED